LIDAGVRVRSGLLFLVGENSHDLNTEMTSETGKVLSLLESYEKCKTFDGSFCELVSVQCVMTKDTSLPM
jgi:hypothetical protein